MTTKNKKSNDTVEKYQAQLHFNIPVNMPSVYATNMLIQATEQEVVVSFYEAQPPLITENLEESLEIINKMGVRADCVAKVTVSYNRFHDFVQLLSDFSEKMKQTEK